MLINKVLIQKSLIHIYFTLEFNFIILYFNFIILYINLIWQN